MILPGHFRTLRTLCLLPFLALLSRPASAYVVEGPSWASGSTVTFQMALGNAGRTLLDGNTSWDLAALPAPTYWTQNVANLRLATVLNPSVSVGKFDGVNSVSFASTFFGSSFGSNTLAITQTSWNGSNHYTEADIVFNNRQNWDSYRGGLRYGSNNYAIGEIRRVFLHELGHALGLDHPDQHNQTVSAVMNSVISSVELLTADDVKGAQALYQAPSTSATPTPTPTATPTPTPTPSATPLVPTIMLVGSPTAVRTGGTANYTVTASFVNPQAPVTVNYSMSGTAIQGTNYQLSTGHFTIPAGSNTATVTLTALKGGKRAKSAMMILAPSSSYSLGFSRSAGISIRR